MNQKLINSYLSVLCPLCNKHTNIINDQNSGELICTICGSVIIDNTDIARSEWSSSNIQEIQLQVQENLTSNLKTSKPLSHICKPEVKPLMNAVDHNKV